jgi:murein DD-endopeptidase MepM/ murein hydrolase activator NlpD
MNAVHRISLRTPNPEGGGRARRRAAIAVSLALALVATAGSAAEPRAASRYAYAPLGARHDDSVRYRLPFELWVPRMLAQGVGGAKTHHTPATYHSFDFAMPVGTPVVAAREGVVVRVQDGFQLGSADPFRKGNAVTILHDDGTFADYLHLSPGIPVQEGKRVARGERLGLSGNTGYTSAPHLHFAVRRRSAPDAAETVPVRFGLGPGPGYVPEPWQFYGSPPRPNVTIRVSIDGEPVGRGVGPEVPIRRGDSVQLRVDWVARSGAVRNVTAHPRTRFGSMLLWTTTVDPSGRVSARPTPGFEETARNPEIASTLDGGTVVVLFGRPGDRAVGVQVVDFRISDEAAPRDDAIRRSVPREAPGSAAASR